MTVGRASNMICRKDYRSRDSLGVRRLGHGAVRGAPDLTDCLAMRAPG